MARKIKPKAKDTENEVEDIKSPKDINEEHLVLDEKPDMEEESSGAELYIEEPVEEDLDDDEELEDDLEEKPDEHVEDEDYEKIKQDLLKEYTENKTAVEGEEEATQQEASEDLLWKVTEEINQEAKIDSDENIDIEDVQESLEGGVINKSIPLTEEEQIVTPDVDQGISKVAISKGSSVALMIGVILFLAFIIYKILQPSEEELAAKESTINKDAPIVTPVEDVGQTIVVPEIPNFPEMPKELVAPAPQALPTPPAPPTLEITPIAPPVSPPTAGDAPSFSSPNKGGTVAPLDMKGSGIGAIDKDAAAKAAAEAARRQARLKSSIMVGGSGSSKDKKNTNDEGQTLSILERNSDQIVATHIGELQRVIASGKVIDAVLETAINTDLPGLIRAVVSRDVYSESGHNILINQGSRLIGSYSSTIKYGQARVQIVWNRVIRPDGIDIKIDSPGIDDIGRSGSGGEVDNHILRNFTTAMMVSLIDIGIAEYADRNGSSGSTTTTTVSTDGGSTTQDDSSAVDDAYSNAIDNIGSIGKDVMEKTMDMPPTITINQGTSLKVFVKRDLIFPGKSANLTRLIE